MKKLLLLLLLLPALLCAQETKEQSVKTTISEATVFVDGAQVLRKKSITLPAGKSIVKFTDLSPYIDAKSVQVKLAGEAMVLAVNYQNNVLEAIKKLSEEKATELDNRYTELGKQLIEERTRKTIVLDEITFLNENKKIGGANTGLSLLTLKETATYYRDRLTALKMKEIEQNRTIAKLEYELKLLQAEISQETGSQAKDKPQPKGEVVLEVDAKNALAVNIELSYYVKNAGWFPSYDIRATSIDKPIQLQYKANIRQNTKEDWNNVKLSVSSANPTLGNVQPQLQTYQLDYNMAPPRYDVDMQTNDIKGTIYDEQGETLPGAVVMIKGTTVGTGTDINGYFSLALPANAREVEISYLGFKPKTMPISKSYMTIYLEEDHKMLSEVVVTGYGTTKNSHTTGSVSRPAPASVLRPDIAMPTQVVETRTAVEFAIKIPYTIKSDNKNTVVEVERYALPASYQYFVVPKVNKDAFLLANVTDWEQYNLLVGEANIFFENTYVGKTILDTRSVSDTLSISLGRDKNILVSRQNVKDQTSKKFLSTKREDVKNWRISVRNTKSQAIQLTLLDQVPISRRSEIEVEIEELSGAQINEWTGEVKWTLDIQPAEKIERNLRYKVKYPNNRTLNVE